MQYSHLDMLESRSIHILREVIFGIQEPLYAVVHRQRTARFFYVSRRKAFYGHVPFPLVHVDTHYKIPEMIEYRDRLAHGYGTSYMIYGENRASS